MDPTSGDLPGSHVAQRDWKKALLDALDSLGDRVRDAVGALDALLAPPPRPVPVPVRRPGHGRG